MAAGLQVEFETVTVVTERRAATLLELSIREALPDSPGVVTLTFVPQGEDGSVDRSRPPKVITIRDEPGSPQATLMRTAVLDAVAAGPAAETLQIVGLTLREAGQQILAGRG
ncbi:MAG: hypothetical protein FJX77_02180 [Armatimonadetes bacterium]|nr:hypothetical protein [Armatimonadota bacterium]